MTQGFGPPRYRLYDECVETPELAKFHCHLDKWPWILNSQNAMIARKFKECNDAVADIQGIARDRNVFRITDYHRANVAEEHPVLQIMAEDLTGMVRRYSKDFILAHHVANLPEQDPVFAQHLAEHPDLFDNGVYGPTNEDAELYQQVPPHALTRCLKGGEENDLFTDFLEKHMKSMYKILCKVINSMQRTPPAATAEEPAATAEEPALPKYVASDSIRRAINCIAAVYVTLLLTGTLGILSGLGSDAKRIATLGCLALVLTMSFILLVPALKRNDLFAVTAAYFAVGGIYIGAKSIGSRDE